MRVGELVGLAPARIAEWEIPGACPGSTWNRHLGSRPMMTTRVWSRPWRSCRLAWVLPLQNGCPNLRSADVVAGPQLSASFARACMGHFTPNLDNSAAIDDGDCFPFPVLRPQLEATSADLGDLPPANILCSDAQKTYLNPWPLLKPRGGKPAGGHPLSQASVWAHLKRLGCGQARPGQAYHYLSRGWADLAGHTGAAFHIQASSSSMEESPHRSAWGTLH